MAADERSILRELDSVAAHRAARARDPALAARVHALKEYQQRRFARTHADLLADPRYAAAARFFLEDLDRKSTRLNSSHSQQSRMPSSA